ALAFLATHSRAALIRPGQRARSERISSGVAAPATALVKSDSVIAAAYLVRTKTGEIRCRESLADQTNEAGQRVSRGWDTHQRGTVRPFRSAIAVEVSRAGESGHLL